MVPIIRDRACPTVFHQLSRVAGPSQQGPRLTPVLAGCYPRLLNNTRRISP